MSKFFCNFPFGKMVYCNGLRSRSLSSRKGLVEFANSLREAGVSSSAGIQINLDWKPIRVSNRDYLNSAIDIFGDRLTSIVNYLDPAHNGLEIENLLGTKLNTTQILPLRIILRGAQSVFEFISIVKNLTVNFKQDGTELSLWPVLSIDSMAYEWWKVLYNELGSLTELLFFQVSHQSPNWMFDVVNPSSVLLAQVAIGMEKDISWQGEIYLAEGMVVQGRYNLLEYFNKLDLNDIKAAKVIMGPSLPGWNLSENDKRLIKMINIMESLSSLPQYANSELGAFTHADAYQ